MVDFTDPRAAIDRITRRRIQDDEDFLTAMVRSGGLLPPPANPPLQIKMTNPNLMPGGGAAMQQQNLNLGTKEAAPIPIKTVEEVQADATPTELPDVGMSREDKKEAFKNTLGSDDEKTRDIAKDMVEKIKEDGGTEEDAWNQLRTLGAYIAMDKEQPGENFWNVLGRAAGRMHLEREQNKKAAAALKEKREYEEAQKEKEREFEMQKIAEKGRLAAQESSLAHKRKLEQLEYSANADERLEAKKALAKRSADKREADQKQLVADKKASQKSIDDLNKRFDGKLGHEGRSAYESYASSSVALKLINQAKSGVDDKGNKLTPQAKYGMITLAAGSMAKAIYGGAMTEDEFNRGINTNPWLKQKYEDFKNLFIGKEYEDSKVEALWTQAQKLTKDYDKRLADSQKNMTNLIKNKYGGKWREVAGAFQNDTFKLNFHNNKNYNFTKLENAKAYIRKHGYDEDNPWVSINGRKIKVYKSKAEMRADDSLLSWQQGIVVGE